jgi:Na+/H+-dicarboxylate symporter
MKTQCCSPATKYATLLTTSFALYAAALVVSLLWLKADPQVPWKYLIAILPVLPAMGIPVAVIRFIQSMDEIQLRLQLESLAFGFAATAIVTFTYGFLQNAGLPDVSWVWVWPVMAMCWIIGQLAARWRYR